MSIFVDADHAIYLLTWGFHTDIFIDVNNAPID